MFGIKIFLSMQESCEEPLITHSTSLNHSSSNCFQPGDPTKFGNFGPPPAAVEAVVKIFRDGKTDGYPKSSGLDEAREALAKLCSTEGSVLTKDVRFVLRHPSLANGATPRCNLRRVQLLT